MIISPIVASLWKAIFICGLRLKFLLAWFEKDVAHDVVSQNPKHHEEIQTHTQNDNMETQRVEQEINSTRYGQLLGWKP